MRCSTHWSRTPAAATTPDRPGPSRRRGRSTWAATRSATCGASRRSRWSDGRGVTELEGRERLPLALVGLMRDIGMPNGLEALGYAGADIPDLVEGGMKQQRMHSGCPRPLNPAVLGDVLQQSLQLW